MSEIVDRQGNGAPTLIVRDPEEIAYELRCAEGATWTAGKLLVGIGAFFYVGLGFAYFYLRSANDLNLWRPGHVTAPETLGALVFAFTMASAVMNVYGTMRGRREAGSVDWEVAGWASVAGLLAATAFQVWELTRLPFTPGSSGYASLFVAWAGMNIATLLLAAYWLETLLARMLRIRRAVAQDGGAYASPQASARLWRANLESATYYLGFVALVNLLFWVFFYLIV